MARIRMHKFLRGFILANFVGLAPSPLAIAWADSEIGGSLPAPAADGAENEPPDDADSDAGDGDAQDPEPSPDLTALRKLKAPDGSNEYGEVYQMRVLERSLLPSQYNDNADPHAASASGGFGLLPPRDPMGLWPDDAYRALDDASSDGQTHRGFQRQSTQLMTAAVQAVQKQIQTAGSGLVLPFGIDCLGQKTVQEYIAVFSAPGAGTMKTWLKRMARWKSALERVLAQEDVPLDLVYLAMIESGFKTRVKSPAAAAGMWQFMAGTAVEMGLRIDAYVDERFDPIKAARAAAGYLKKQYARYNSWPLAMAAYNGGPGTVNVAIDRYNSTDYFKLVQYGAMYDETRRYVPRILAAAVIGKNPAAFGFDGLRGEEPFVFDTVRVPGNVKLALLAQAADCSVQTLEELNPELLKSTTPPGEDYDLRIPAGQFDRFVGKFDNIKKNYPHASDSMTLRFGETVDTLAADIGTPARVLRQINHLGSKDNLPYGADIAVPNGSKRNKTAKKDEDDRPVALISPETFSFNQKKRIFYVTQKGDSVAAIAKAFRILPNQIAIWNDLDVWAKLRPNMFLQVFVDKDFSDDGIRYFAEDEVRPVVKGSQEHQDIIDAKRKTNAKAASSAKSSDKRYVYHTVAKGDSVSKIAKKYGTSVETILKLNKMKASDPIRKGEKIIVKKK